MLPFSAIVALALAVLLGALWAPDQSNGAFVRQARKQPPTRAKNVLIVTAHPDDEAMFFAPTIIALSKNTDPGEHWDFSLFHLCLSTGDAEGLGEIRKKELSNSLEILGVHRLWRFIVDHPELRDGMDAQWDPKIIASIMETYVTERSIDTILTFDTNGISSHPNHKAIPAAALELLHTLNSTIKPPQTLPRVFRLDSTPLLLKYTSIASAAIGKADIYMFRGMRFLEDAIISALSMFYPELLTPEVPFHPDAHAMPLFISGIDQYKTALKAMMAHESQMVWFRWLYVAFSKYMWVNSYTVLTLEPPKTLYP